MMKAFVEKADQRSDIAWPVSSTQPPLGTALPTYREQHSMNRTEPTLVVSPRVSLPVVWLALGSPCN